MIQGWEVVRAEHLQALWKEKYSEWQKRPKSKLCLNGKLCDAVLFNMNPFLNLEFIFLIKIIFVNIDSAIYRDKKCSTMKFAKESHKTEVTTQCFIPYVTYRISQLYWSMNLTYTTSLAKKYSRTGQIRKKKFD